MLSCLFMPQAGITESAIDLDLLQGIPNVVFLQEDVIGGGVPSQEALEEVKRQGFQSVIDLRTAIEGTFFEQASVKKLGIKYFNIPINSSNISEEQVKRLEEILTDPDNKPGGIAFNVPRQIVGIIYIHIQRIFRHSCRGNLCYFIDQFFEIKINTLQSDFTCFEF